MEIQEEHLEYAMGELVSHVNKSYFSIDMLEK